MKRFVYFLLVFLYSVSTIALSQNKTDSLLTLFNKERNADKKIKLAKEIGILTYMNNPELCKEVIKKAIKDSSQITEKLILGKCFNLIGVVYQYQALYDSSNMYFKKYLAIGQKEKDAVSIGTAWNNLAINRKCKGEFTKAIDLYIKSIEVYENEGMITSKAGVQNDIANIYALLANFPKAKEYLDKGLDLLAGEDMNKKEIGLLMGNFYNTYGYIFERQEMRDSALTYYYRSLEYKEKTGNLYSWCNTKNNICILYRENPDKCISCINDLIEVQKKINDRAGIVRSMANKAVSMFDKGDYMGALKVNLTILNEYYDELDLETKVNLHKNISSDYAELGDYKKAFQYRVLYGKYNDSLRSESINKEILEMSIKYETEKKDKEIAESKVTIAESKAEIAESKLLISNRNKVILITIIATIALFFFMLYIIQRNLRKAQDEKNKAIIAEQEKGLVAVINAQEEERKRVARDLHDGIGQQISALNINFRLLMKNIGNIPESALPDVESIHKMITDTGSDVRNISHQMMPRALTEFGLVDALEDMIEKSFKGIGVACKFEQFDMEKRLPDTVEIGLYRITQELINNILKHSGASHVDIILRRTETHCILSVQDDGKGIAVKDTDGIGMRNMNSRINALKGEFNIESEKHKGTSAVIKIKLNETGK